MQQWRPARTTIVSRTESLPSGSVKPVQPGDSPEPPPEPAPMDADLAVRLKERREVRHELRERAKEAKAALDEEKDRRQRP